MTHLKVNEIVVAPTYFSTPSPARSLFCLYILYFCDLSSELCVAFAAKHYFPDSYLADGCCLP